MHVGNECAEIIQGLLMLLRFWGSIMLRGLPQHMSKMLLVTLHNS